MVKVATDFNIQSICVCVNKRGKVLSLGTWLPNIIRFDSFEGKKNVMLSKKFHTSTLICTEPKQSKLYVRVFMSECISYKSKIKFK